MPPTRINTQLMGWLRKLPMRVRLQAVDIRLGSAARILSLADTGDSITAERSAGTPFSFRQTVSSRDRTSRQTEFCRRRVAAGRRLFGSQTHPTWQSTTYSLGRGK